MRNSIVFALLLAAAAPLVVAGDMEDYNRRAAERDMATFHAYAGADRVLTPQAIRGELDLGPRFNDIDINRDGRITVEEMKRYIEQKYHVRLEG